MNATIRGILKQQVTELRHMLLRRINVFEQQVAELKHIDQDIPPVFEEPETFVLRPMETAMVERVSSQQNDDSSTDQRRRDNNGTSHSLCR
jgi:hypothetical protein